MIPKPDLSHVNFGSGGGVAAVSTASQDLKWKGRVVYAITVDSTKYSCYIQVQNKMTRRVLGWSNRQTSCAELDSKTVMEDLNLGRMGDEFVRKVSEILQLLLK